MVVADMAVAEAAVFMVAVAGGSTVAAVAVFMAAVGLARVLGAAVVLRGDLEEGLRAHFHGLASTAGIAAIARGLSE